jgi:hypothetical protein
MSDVWYYVDSERAVGPLALADLAKALRSRPRWKATPVWCEGLADWQKAGDVAELYKWIVTPPWWRRPRNVIILSACTLIELLYVGALLYVGIEKPPTFSGLFSLLFAGLVGGLLLGILVIGIADALARLRKKFPRAAFYVGTVAFWFGIMVCVWCVGVSGYLVFFERTPITVIGLTAAPGLIFGLLGWSIRRALTR